MRVSGQLWQKGRFPLVYGADCAVLLGAVPGLADVLGGAGLVFIDGHEDATTMEACTTGEAANMEVAFLLGMTGSERRNHCAAMRVCCGRRQSPCWGCATACTAAKSQPHDRGPNTAPYRR